MRLYITYCMHTQITYLHIRILKKKKEKKKKKKAELGGIVHTHLINFSVIE